MTYNIIINYEIYAENLSKNDLSFELSRLTLSECISFLPREEYYLIRVEYVEDGEVVEWENIAEYFEGDIKRLYDEAHENDIFHEWQDLIK